MFQLRVTCLCFIFTNSVKDKRIALIVIAFNHIKSLCVCVWCSLARARVLLLFLRYYCERQKKIEKINEGAAGNLTGWSCGCGGGWLKRFCGGLMCFPLRVGSCPPLAVLNAQCWTATTAREPSTGRSEHRTRRPPALGRCNGGALQYWLISRRITRSHSNI